MPYLRSSRVAGLVLLGGFSLGSPAFCEPAAAPAALVQSATDPDRGHLAANLLDLQHTRIVLDGWRKMLMAETAAPDCGCSNVETKARFTKAWQAAVERAFDTGRIYTKLQDALAASLSAADRS